MNENHYHPTEVHCRLLTQGKVLICPYASCHSCKIRFRTRPLPRQSLLGSGLRDSPCAMIGGALCHPALRAPLARLPSSPRLRRDKSPASCGAAYNSQGACPLLTMKERTGTPPAASAGERERAGDIKRHQSRRRASLEARNLKGSAGVEAGF